MTNRVSLISALLGLTLAAMPVMAQDRTNGDRVIDTKRAAQLEIEADRLAQDMKTFKKAAKRYLEAASLRPDGDAQAVQDVITAARLYFYRGSYEKSYRLMVDGAERASAMGDVVTAVHAFVDAAHIAIRLENGVQVLDNLERGRLLARSPLLRAADRAQLTARLGTPTAVAAGRNRNH